MKIIDKKLAELTPYANNPRLNDGAVDAVAARLWVTKEPVLKSWEMSKLIPP